MVYAHNADGRVHLCEVGATTGSHDNAPALEPAWRQRDVFIDVLIDGWIEELIEELQGQH